MTYQINDVLTKNIFPEEVETTISLFRRLYIDTYQYKVYRTINYKLFIGHKGKFVPILSKVVQDNLLGVFSFNNKFYQQPFFEEYNLEKNDIFNSLFEQTLVSIETAYSRYLMMGKTVSSSFKKALSFVLETKQKFGVLHIAYKFFVSSFSFVHGVFRIRNFNLFHGEKKFFIKFGTNKVKDVSYNHISAYYSNKIIVRNKEFKNVEEIDLSSKQYNLFLRLISLFDCYNNKLNSNPFIANAIYCMGLSIPSKKRLSLNYLFEQNFIVPTIKPIRLKHKEYASDIAYYFRNMKDFQNSTFHPVSLISNHDYVDFSVEHLDKFMQTSLTLSDSKKLFDFIDLVGADYTFDLLNYKEDFGNQNDFYLEIISFIKSFDKHTFLPRIDKNEDNEFVFSSFYNIDRFKFFEKHINTFFNEMIDSYSFKYKLNCMSDIHFLNDFISGKTNNVHHIFYLSLLKMSGVNLHSLSFSEAFNYPIKGSLSGDNLILETQILSFISKNLLNLELVFDRKEFLKILFLIKKINLFVPDDEVLNLNRLFRELTSLNDLSKFSLSFFKNLKSFNSISDIQMFFRENNLNLFLRTLSIDNDIFRGVPIPR